jgi:iron complex transport system ATP-binding protein
MSANQQTVPDVAIRAEQVGLVLDENRILDSLSIDIRRGEILALVGPNGAGKSSLLAVLSGDMPPTEGRVLLDGRELDSYRPIELARRRAVLTQENAVTFPFRVREVVEMGRSPWARTPQFEDDQAAIAAALAKTDVSHLADRRYTRLSGGEKARVSLARVLAQRAGILFLDEPTAALDLRHQEEVLRTAGELAAGGAAVVVVLHELSLAGAYADRIALISAGRLAKLGDPATVLTADLISEVYGLDVEILTQESTGRPMVLPKRAPHSG